MRVRELAEVSRPETLPISGAPSGPVSGPISGWAAFSAETAAVIRARLGGAIPEMIEAIAAGVPEYASRTHPGYRQRLADAVTGAVACFIVHVARPDQSTLAIMAEFRAIGGTAAREGRTLDALQDALRLGARVAWRWLCAADAGLRDRRLAPLAQLRPGQRDRIAETLLAWLQLGENATEVAQRIHVHPQTVRYRLRQIQELFGDQLRDPDRRFELHLALRIRTLSASASHTEAVSSAKTPGGAAVADEGRSALGSGDGGGRPRVTGTVAGWTRSRPRHRNGNLRKPGRCAGRLVYVWWLCGGRSAQQTGATDRCNYGRC